MRTLLFAAAALILSQTTLAQNNKETIEGNGHLITRDVAVQSFDALEASGVYELKLTQGDKEAVRIEADENLQNLFSVTSDGSKLKIDTKKLNNKNLKTKNKMRVHITFRRLRNIEIGTVGSVNSVNDLKFDDLDIEAKNVGNVSLSLTANKLNLENKSVGNIKLSGKAQNAVVKNKGVGSLEAADFVVQTMDIENNGVGHAEVNAEKTLTVKDSFLGKVKNRGAAPARKMNKVVI
ncbi:MAG TPA: head GIN domain-containing protein [Chitinophagaceae bacterium]|nr:head GIN domain-containing protein [Chitinophagaceae bacterium]